MTVKDDALALEKLAAGLSQSAAFHQRAKRFTAAAEELLTQKKLTAAITLLTALVANNLPIPDFPDEE